MAAVTSYSLDRSVRCVGGGRVVIGGSPLRLFRLSAAGAALFDRLRRGEAVATNPLIDRLLDSGAIHPRRTSTIAADQVTVVIPAFGASNDVLTRLIGQVGFVAELLIVDDASPTPIPVLTGASTIRHPTNRGPGAARMTGLAEAKTPFVAFVDTDVALPPDWLLPLLAHFDDQLVAAVAPRVASRSGSSLIERYETHRSPLDLGSDAARVHSGSRVSYVPAAVLICRTEALNSVGGFDPGLRVGEDVDLVWRLTAAGFRVRYEPSVVAVHAPRSSLQTLIHQRFSYGTSAATLAERHPGALAPVIIDRTSAGAWLLAIIGRPFSAAVVAVVSTARFAFKLRSIPDGTREAVRLAGLGNLYAGRSIAGAAIRAWWPISLLAALVSTRARYLLATAAVVPAGIDWIRSRPDIQPPHYLALRIIDDMAYGSGVAVGCWRRRSIASVLPRLTHASSQRER